MSAAMVLGEVASLRSTSDELKARCECRPDETVDAGQATEGVAFYRKYTERVLRRYMRTSMQMGRSPSVLGNLVFRGKSSHSIIKNFEDAVIFVHDIDSCLKKLDSGGRELIARIALQEYTQHEVAKMMSMSARSVMRRYAETIDNLTEILLAKELLEVF